MFQTEFLNIMTNMNKITEGVDRFAISPNANDDAIVNSITKTFVKSSASSEQGKEIRMEHFIKAIASLSIARKHSEETTSMSPILNYHH